MSAAKDRIEAKRVFKAILMTKTLGFGKLNPGVSIRCSLSLAATQPAFDLEFAVLEWAVGRSNLMDMGWNTRRSVEPCLSGMMQLRMRFAPIFLITTGTHLVGSMLPYLFFAKTDPILVKRRAVDKPDHLG